MKKIITIVAVISALITVSCVDESLNPLPIGETGTGWDYGVHGFMVYDGINGNGTLSRPQPYEVDYAKNFPIKGQDNAKIDFKIRWVSLDNKLTVNKIEIMARMDESYNDPDGNPKWADLSGNGNGKLLTTLTAGANRAWTTFSVTPAQIYNLYKDATVKYDKVKAVKVFENPARPRPAGARFRTDETADYGDVAADDFTLTYVLYTTDGRKFNIFEPGSICGDPTPASEANANCTKNFGVY